MHSHAEKIDVAAAPANLTVCAASVVLAALLVFAFSTQSHAQAPGISLMIEKHASLTREGIVVIWIRIVCGPFAGIEQFQEGRAGGGQDKTGASSESGIDGTVICQCLQW